MKLKLAEWAEREYSDKSRPHISTLRKMAKCGEIRGSVQTSTGHWFVVVDAPDTSIEDRIKALTDNPIMKRAMGQ